MRPPFSPQPKKKTHRSRAFLDFVRSLPCCNCGAPPRSEASHFGGNGKSGGMGLKASDLYVAPLCHDCHAGMHSQGHLPGMLERASGGMDLDSGSAIVIYRDIAGAMSRAAHIEANRDALAAYVEQLEGKK